MALDTSIYGLLNKPAEIPDPLQQYSRALTLKGLMGQQEVNDLQAAKLKRDFAADETLRGLFARNAEPSFAEVAAIDPAKAIALEKNRLEAKKSNAEIRKLDLDALSASLKTHRDQLAGVQTPEQAAQWVQAGYNDPVLSSYLQRSGSPQEMIAQIPTDPSGFAKWKMANGLGIEKFMELTAPKPQLATLGGTSKIVEMNPQAPGFNPNVDLTHTPTIGEQESQRHNKIAEGIAQDRNAIARQQNVIQAGNQTVTNEGKLRDDYNNASKEFVKVRDAHQRVLASSRNPTAAGDLALIFNYMKVLDPGSTVREGEFATAQNSGGISDRVRAQYNKVLNGERLDQNMRNDFVQRSNMLYTDAETNQKTLEGQYRAIATRSKLNPENVVTEQRVQAQAAQRKVVARKVISGKPYVKMDDGNWYPE